jgi:capsular exopolysaccharide synthesis family protein
VSLTEIIRVLRARWLIVVTLTLLGLGAAAAASFSATPIYQAESTLYFSLPAASSGTDLSQGSNYTQAQMLSYAALAKQPIVLDQVRADLGLPAGGRLEDQVGAKTSNNTVVIDLTVDDADPRRAADIANSLARSLGDTVRELSPQSVDGEATITATITATATPPRFPSSPQKKRNLAAGLIAGAVLGVLAALARQLLDTRVRSADDVKALTTVPVLGEIALAPGSTTPQLRMSSHGAEAEAFRRLRTNLEFVNVEARPQVLLLTSAVSGEGKSSTCINLGMSIAQSGKRVLLVDGDLRRPSLGPYLGLESGVGLTTALIGRAGVGDLVQPSAHDDLDVLTSGAIPPNPAELLGSTAMKKILDEVGYRYDVILIDSPPIMAVADAAILSRVATGTVLVAGCAKIHQNELSRAVEAMQAVETPLLGVVVNQVSGSRVSSYESYESLPQGRDVRKSGRSARRRTKLLSRSL